MKKHIRYLKVFKNREEYESKRYELMGIPYVILLKDTYEVSFNNGTEVPNYYQYDETLRLFKNFTTDGEKVILSGTATVNGDVLLLDNNNEN
jgi:hypothetical protein